MTESLLLKWGTVKAWEGLTEKSQEIMRRYFADGMSMSCMSDHPNAERRSILCELIDQFEGEIQEDWNGKKLSKEEAKKYVNEYGQR